MPTIPRAGKAVGLEREAAMTDAVLRNAAVCWPSWNWLISSRRPPGSVASVDPVTSVDFRRARRLLVLRGGD